MAAGVVRFTEASLHLKESFARTFVREYHKNKEECSCEDNIDMAQRTASQVSVGINGLYFDVDYEQGDAVMVVYADDPLLPTYRRIETVRPAKKRPRAAREPRVVAIETGKGGRALFTTYGS